MRLKITPLGVGNGTSYILRGNPSSSFVISKNDYPFLMVDCGVGIGLSFKKHFGDQVPRYLYITHNHLDHTGELPILLLDFYKKQGSPVEISGSQEVLDIVREYRMHELYDTGIDIDKIANWSTPDKKDLINLEDGYSLRLTKSQHSYACYGFLLLYDGTPILGYSGDSGFNKETYGFVAQAEQVILDGRAKGSYEHASFLEIDQYASQHPEKQFYITHHEIGGFEFNSENVAFLEIGEEVEINK